VVEPFEVQKGSVTKSHPAVAYLVRRAGELLKGERVRQSRSPRQPCDHELPQ
jgi:hypothetical protein